MLVDKGILRQAPQAGKNKIRDVASNFIGSVVNYVSAHCETTHISIASIRFHLATDITRRQWVARCVADWLGALYSVADDTAGGSGLLDANGGAVWSVRSTVVCGRTVSVCD